MVNHSKLPAIPIFTHDPFFSIWDTNVLPTAGDTTHRCGAEKPIHGRVTIDGVSYRAATNIGVHPTVGESPAPLCESFLIDYAGGDLYGKTALCEPIAFVRPERHFDSLEELREQVERDIRAITRGE